MSIMIVADKNIPYLKGIAEHFGDVVYISGNDFTHENVKEADALIVRTVAHLDETVLKGSNVKLICTATIGYDHIDIGYCEAHNIAWRNAPGCNSSSVQQYVASVLVSLAIEKGFDLAGKKMGVVGVGNVGSKVAKIGELLGMKVLLNDPLRQEAENCNDFVDIETIKSESDIITFHTPLSKDGKYPTYHLADSSFFGSLGKKPVIINSSRGGVVNTKAMTEAIKSGFISEAVIDCWENEPDIDVGYMNLAHIATPHIAGYSADGKANATRMSLTSLADFFGLDPSPVEQIQVPQPDNPVIDLNQFDKNLNRIWQTIIATYNPIDDDNRLRNSPENFKQLRNNYPLRREFPAYTVLNASAEEKSLLLALGFKCS